MHTHGVEASTRACIHPEECMEVNSCKYPLTWYRPVWPAGVGRRWPGLLTRRVSSSGEGRGSRHRGGAYTGYMHLRVSEPGTRSGHADV
jgi:hypothetical protein